MKIEPIVIRKEKTSLICPFCGNKLVCSYDKIENEWIIEIGGKITLCEQSANLELKCFKCRTLLNIETHGDIDKKVCVK